MFCCAAYCVTVSGLMLFSESGTALAVLLVFFAPGYALISVMFPRNDEVRWPARIALSFGTSIVTVALIGFLLDLSPWGLRFVPIVVSIALFVVTASALGYWRRMALAPESRLAATLEIGLPRWRALSLGDKLVTAALIALIGLAAWALAALVAAPESGNGFTEFYLLGPTGLATGYPARLNVSENGTVIVGVANHE